MKDHPHVGGALGQWGCAAVCLIGAKLVERSDSVRIMPQDQVFELLMKGWTVRLKELCDHVFVRNHIRHSLKQLATLGANLFENIRQLLLVRRRVDSL